MMITGIAYCVLNTVSTARLIRKSLLSFINCIYSNLIDALICTVCWSAAGMVASRLKCSKFCVRRQTTASLQTDKMHGETTLATTTVARLATSMLIL